jgi:hypothetical protein
MVLCGIVYFGITDTAHWTNESRQLFKNSLSWALGEYDSDNDGFVDSLDKCPFDYGVDNGCPKISSMEIEKEKNDFTKILDEQKVVNRIEKHEKQTTIIICISWQFDSWICCYSADISNW